MRWSIGNTLVRILCFAMRPVLPAEHRTHSRVILLAVYDLVHSHFVRIDEARFNHKMPSVAVVSYTNVLSRTSARGCSLKLLMSYFMGASNSEKHLLEHATMSTALSSFFRVINVVQSRKSHNTCYSRNCIKYTTRERAQANFF
uniref:Secreted protein n=1 Tax=Rhipicephalus zambeziensis TaxID=60191 RepID=A0A224Y715_9ACAR